MTFTSNFFLIGVLPWYLILNFLTAKKITGRKMLLFVANSVFYMWGGIGAALSICVVCIESWLFCRLLRKIKSKCLLALGCMSVLVPLFSVKYADFISKNLNGIFGFHLANFSLLVPIGISFFTFEAISCLCDVYSEKVKEDISLLDMYLYLSFFPTVVSGPIMRINDFRNGYKELSVPSYEKGIERIVWGLSKKMLIADKIAVLADYYFNGVAAGHVYSCLGYWIGSVAYTLQLYFDFSGYSDMAIGIGLLLGFEVPENFNKPYQAASIQEFWTKWHISLSRWFRDYIYIPLGGNRCSKTRHLMNLLIVWLLTGIWHGADWSFVVWGMGYFLLIAAEKYCPFMEKIGTHWCGHVYSLFFINLLWIPFRCADMGVTGRYIKGMFDVYNTVGLEDKAIGFLPFVISVCVFCLPWQHWTAKLGNCRWADVMRKTVLILLAVFAICAMVNTTYAPYLYGNF